MTAAVESYEITGRKTKILSRSQIRKARISGVALFLMAAVIMLVFVPAVSGVSTFGVSTVTDFIQLSPISVPSAGSLWILSGVLAFLGTTQFMRGFQTRTTIFLGIGFGVFVLAMMVWASSGQQFSLVSMLTATVARSTPIALGALSGILCERSGVVNIGIEGMLLGGAFTGVVMGSILGGWIGLIAATLTGGILALLLAVLSVNFRVDQIIIGVVINILVL
ncbi:MAG: ABC transporter permease, partial [Actinomycetota bacterium]|nr:ABC transporter permease [Actinomycetota bacterium]